MKFAHAVHMMALATSTLAFKVEEVAVPSTEDDKHSNIATTFITVGEDKYETSYNIILRTGDKLNGVTFGAVHDENGTAIMAYPGHDNSSTAYVEDPLGNKPTKVPLVSTVADFTSLISTPMAGAPTEFAMFAHFETPLPASIYRINVDFTDDCHLDKDSIEATDWKEWGGLWEPCSAKVTPWNTHLGSEEHEPDARVMSMTYEEFTAAYEEGNPTVKNIMLFMRYYGLLSSDLKKKGGMDTLRKTFNPYKYGHVTELSVEDDGSTKTQKWYTTGRVSIENPEIMPDNKTVYIADDANYGILTRFVMDKASDMSSGTLYAAKFTQVEGSTASVSRVPNEATLAGGFFETEWLQLGKATHEEIHDLVWTDGVTFIDIFDAADPDEDDSCPEGYTFIITGWGPRSEECLMVKEGMETAAAFLETRRYAAMLGATAELQATEGLASVPKDKKFYLAMSSISNGMNELDEPLGHIGVVENKCGCVYEFDVDNKMALTTGRALICGEPIADDPLNACSTDSIASPDNLFYTGTFGTKDDHSLLIAEDTSNHQNDYLWHYDLATGEMTRILSSVYGSQVTGAAYFADNKGCYLLMAIVPHPYKKSDTAEVDSDNENNMGLAGNVGYIGPIGSRTTGGEL